MRTKADLLRELERAAEFNRRPLVLMRRKDEIRMRDRYGFQPTRTYGWGMLPLTGELGCDRLHRFISRVAVQGAA